MAWSRLASPLALLVSCGIGGCGTNDPASSPEAPGAELGRLDVVEVTTITTVQGSSGIFLSPRALQQRPSYLEERAVAGDADARPSLEEDRAKVDTALLFRGSGPGELRVEVALGDIQPRHFFPAVRGARWPISLGAEPEGDAESVWSEWGGWAAYAGRAVGTAPAATLDYEQLGLRSPLVLASEGDDQISVTNRSNELIGQALLVYSHVGGIGIRAVTELGPGMREVTTPGPKEGPLAFLLEKARGELEAFFVDAAGPELGRAIARAKSVPLLETPGLRLVYLRDATQAPAALTLPRGLASERRFVLAQAEVLLPTDEQSVVELVQGGLQAAEVPEALGRFSRAKLELAALSQDAEVRARAEALLQTLGD